MKNAFRVDILILLLFTLGSNRWMNWHDGIRYVRADDSKSYEFISQAAPGLPGRGPLYHHLQRIFAHYIVGSVANIAGLDMGHVYEAATLLYTFLIVWMAYVLLLRLGLERVPRFLLLSAFVMNPYTFRYYWLAPTMLADLVFVLGTGIWILGLVEKKFTIVLAGAFLASLGRQSSLLVLPGVAFWMYYAADWRTISLKTRCIYFFLVSLVVIGVYQITGYFALSIAGYVVHGPHTFITFFTWLVGDTFTWHMLFEHTLRTFIPAFTLLSLSLGLYFGISKSKRKPLPMEFWGAWIMAAGLGAQPFVVNPIDMGRNESRQSALALIAAFAATGYLFQRMPKKLTSIWLAAAIFSGLVLASLHHLYTLIGPQSASQFLALHLGACALVGVALYLSTKHENNSGTNP